MAEEMNQHRWQEGHPRYGGRKKRTAAQARQMAEEMGIDPIQFLLSIIKADSIEQTVIEGGKKKRVTVTIPLEVRIDAAKYVSRFCYPVLSATQVTGADEGPVQVVGADMTALIMGDPAMVDAAQRLALLMARPDTLPAPAAPADEPRALPAPDPVETLRTDDRGHWMPR